MVQKKAQANEEGSPTKVKPSSTIQIVTYEERELLLPLLQIVVIIMNATVQ